MELEPNENRTGGKKFRGKSSVLSSAASLSKQLDLGEQSGRVDTDKGPF